MSNKRCCLSLAIAVSIGAWTASLHAAEIVTLGNPKPAASAEREPTGQQLLETWIAGRIWGDGKRFDAERYEILDRKVVWARQGRAILHGRVLPLEGDPVAFAGKTCPGRSSPLEFQFYYQWSDETKTWIMHSERGSDGFEFCKGEPLWTQDQIAKILTPPPMPAPPQVSKKDVRTPAAGSPERKAIMDGMRPAFEKVFGAPVEFKVDELKVAAGFAYALVHPQRPGGRQISKTDWDKAVGPCEQDRKTASAQLWLRQDRGKWSIEWGDPSGVCATDSNADMGYIIGAPPQLVGHDSWGDASFLPIENPQYFELWWLRK